MTKYWIHWTVCSLLIYLAGCGSPTRSPIVEVAGKITYEDGETLPAGTKVVFSPVLGGAGSAMAETDPDGSFVLEHVNGSLGAEVGSYTVALRSPDGIEEEFYNSVPSGYTDGGLLSATVPEDGGSLQLVLKHKRKRR